MKLVTMKFLSQLKYTVLCFFFSLVFQKNKSGTMYQNRSRRFQPQPIALKRRLLTKELIVL